MVCCEEKGLGGDDEVELLREPCRNGLLERFDGLVLLGLGPPAISSFVVTVLRRRVGDKERRSRRVGTGKASECDGQTASQMRQVPGPVVSSAASRRWCVGVKQLRNVVMPKSTFGGRKSQVAIAGEKVADWRAARSDGK
jgi:hypothetical protein